MEIDPVLRQQQEDWVQEIESVETSNSVYSADVFAEVSDKTTLAAIWLQDGVQCRSIDYPQSDFELKCLQVARSRWLWFVYNMAVLTQILIPFFAYPGCASNPEFSRRITFIIIDVVCLLVYCFELWLTFRVNWVRKSFRRKPWSTFRLVCCFLLFLDIVGYSSPQLNSLRVIRCVFPFFLISRRKNLQRMLQGILQSAIRAFPVVKGLVSVLILWAFGGFFIFRNWEVSFGEIRFSEPWNALNTALHCFTSRPFSLLALKPYFAVNPASALFFVTLTLAADLLCIGLITAIATSEYRVFVAKTMTRRLTSRKHALKTVFFAYADNQERFSRDAWAQLCQNMRYSYRRSKLEAVVLFTFEDPNNSGFVDLLGFYRLCALIANGVRVLIPAEASEILSPELLAQTNEGSTAHVINALAEKLPRSTILLAAPQSLVGEAAEVQRDRGSDLTGSSTSMGKLFTVESLGYDDRHHAFLEDAPGVSKNKRRNRNRRLAWLDYCSCSDAQCCIPGTNSVWKQWVNVCSIYATAYVKVGKPYFAIPRTFLVESIYNAILHVILLITLCFLSSGNASIDWYRIIALLEFLFCLDMIVKLSVIELSEYFSSTMNLLDAVVNVAGFVALLCLGQMNGDSQALTAVLVIFLFRLFRLFFVVNDIYIFERILPILYRAAFIYFSVIYFFAIFSHQFFCDSMNPGDADNGDDDAKNWVEFSNELNFSTYLQSMFTIFEMSILANWSIVMDAAARVSGASAYIFFYIFRLTTTLIVIPVLLGFVMMSFLNARSARLKILEDERQQYLKEEQEGEGKEKQVFSDVSGDEGKPGEDGVEQRERGSEYEMSEVDPKYNPMYKPPTVSDSPSQNARSIHLSDDSRGERRTEDYDDDKHNDSMVSASDEPSLTSREDLNEFGESHDGWAGADKEFKSPQGSSTPPVSKKHKSVIPKGDVQFGVTAKKKPEEKKAYTVSAASSKNSSRLAIWNTGQPATSPTTTATKKPLKENSGPAAAGQQQQNPLRDSMSLSIGVQSLGSSVNKVALAQALQSEITRLQAQLEALTADPNQ